MQRVNMINTIGREYLRSNLESADEWSYARYVGGKNQLLKILGKEKMPEPFNFKLDIRFTDSDEPSKSNYSVLIETKHIATESDVKQLKAYVDEEHAIFPKHKVIAILANIDNNEIRVWKDTVDDVGFLKDEKKLENFEYYKNLFALKKQNDRETVMRNTYALNEMLLKLNIEEKNRSQFVGTCLLFIKDKISDFSKDNYINQDVVNEFKKYIEKLKPIEIRAGIEGTLDGLLNNSKNKEKKVELLKKKVLEEQHVKELTSVQWSSILGTISGDIYRYIDINSSEGQDILNLFFITFNKYAGKSDKNQAFTPDHITDFMVKLTEVNKDSVVLDATCGSGSFLVQAMVKEFTDAKRLNSSEEIKKSIKEIKDNHIYGIEKEEIAYGLATTNMLIHGDGNSNIELGNCFDEDMRQFIKDAKPSVILMNPPYNAIPNTIPDIYKDKWSETSKKGKTDPTKGLVFVKYISDIAKSEKWTNTKLAVLLPLQTAIGTKNSPIPTLKNDILKDSTLEAVFTLHKDTFYPGANVQPCCMVFTLNKPHFINEKPRKKTFFGYCREDGFRKKRNAGRIEQFENGTSLWEKYEEEWLKLYNNKETVTGKSVLEYVDGDKEWLAEAYMDTSYADLEPSSFEKNIKELLSFNVKYNTFDFSKKTKKIETPVLNPSTWKKVKTCNLFDLESANGTTTDSLVEGGDTVYIAAKKENNGVKMLVERDEEFITKGNCIVFITLGEGSAGYSLYQPTDFIGMSGKILVGRLKNFELNKYIGVFLVTVLDKERFRYSFGRSWAGDRLRNTEIMLPILTDKDGKPIIDSLNGDSNNGYVPDWQFMEDYIKSLPNGDLI